MIKIGVLISTRIMRGSSLFPKNGGIEKIPPISISTKKELNGNLILRAYINIPTPSIPIYAIKRLGVYFFSKIIIPHTRGKIIYVKLNPPQLKAK